MKILQTTITRSFSAKVQRKQYEPVESFSSRSIVVEGDLFPDEEKRLAKELYEKCVDDVGLDLEGDKSYQRWLDPQKEVRKRAKKDLSAF